MQGTPYGQRARRTLDTIRIRTGTALLVVLYLVIAAAAPTFWRSPRPCPAGAKAGR
ncbi:hypothetical protein ACIA8G_35340 [Lentzea sp. NPDC051213]|uniref:hypothetical protein n=1 Tax=Lentzea sp. NPDC051213 TaxID=3364126 RepID=UPI0037AAADDB